MDALFQLAAEECDLVVTVRQMPKLDGASLILAMRNSGIRIPVILISDSPAKSCLPPEVAREVFAAVSKSMEIFELFSAIVRALMPTRPATENRPHATLADHLAA